jgi:hypothetical protein
MSPEEFQNYLGLLGRLLRLKATQCKAIEEELRSHLEERLSALTAEGVEPTRAVSMALAEFGDAAALAAEFTAVSRLYKRRWIMRFSIGSIAASVIAAALIITYWPGGPVQLAQNTAQAQQAEKSKGTDGGLEGAIVSTAIHEREKLDANAQTQAKLEQIGELDFTETPLEQVKSYLQEHLNVQFYLDRRVLDEAGITSDTPITFSMKNVPFEMMLRLISKEINATYYLDNGVVIITTPDEAEQNLETRVYRVDDLILTQSTDKDKGSADNGVLKFTGADYAGLIDVVTTTVKPETWDTVGRPGSISPYRGTLCISQTAEVHREIKKLLNDLRQSINKNIVDEYKQQQVRRMGGGMMGGIGGMRVMRGGMGGMGMYGASEKSEDGKEKEQTKSDKQNMPAGRTPRAGR